MRSEDDKQEVLGIINRVLFLDKKRTAQKTKKLRGGTQTHSEVIS
jgi:hypothetical protein